MKINELIQQPEGRRLEFKATLPTHSELSKTIVAFANDAGGDLFIGIQDNPRKVVGIPEDQLMALEEQISNLIHDTCYPIIVPDISFHGNDGLRFIRVQIFRGSNFPYFLKAKGKREGTFIRVGSTNRQANDEIIAELERQKRNISFDGEPVYGAVLDTAALQSFQNFYQEKTGEVLSDVALKKLDLIKEYQGSFIPTNACILFSESKQRIELFPYAKIECARFKGVNSEVFIDQKTIDENISVQAELAYDFVLRHINKGATVKGVYTESRWEYPIVAIRETLRNAVVHRDYSLSGKDIKVAIYDDMVEITSPGKIMPSIDFNELDARQSDIRNKVIAPVFKKLGIIDQWGNGLKLIGDELKMYPEIEFKWQEKGLQFQVQFIKKEFINLNIDYQEVLREITSILDLTGTKSALSRHQVGTKSAPSQKNLAVLSQLADFLSFMTTEQGVVNLMSYFGWKDRTKFRAKYINPLLKLNIINMTLPEKPTSSNQQYYLSDLGHNILKYLQEQLPTV